jgi:hypothetical protein
VLPICFAFVAAAVAIVVVLIYFAFVAVAIVIVVYLGFLSHAPLVLFPLLYLIAIFVAVALVTEVIGAAIVFPSFHVVVVQMPLYCLLCLLGPNILSPQLPQNVPM